MARALVAVRSLHRFLRRRGRRRPADPAADVDVPRVPARPAQGADRGRGRRAARRRGRATTRSPGGTGPSSRCSTAPGCASPSWSACRWATSTSTAACCGPSARGPRSGSCPARPLAPAGPGRLARRRRAGPALEPERWARRGDAEAVFLNPRGGRLTRQGAWGVVRKHGDRVGLGDRLTPARAAPLAAPPTCSTTAPTSGPCRSCWATPRSATTQVYTEGVAPSGCGPSTTSAHPRAAALGGSLCSMPERRAHCGPLRASLEARARPAAARSWPSSTTTGTSPSTRTSPTRARWRPSRARTGPWPSQLRRPARSRSSGPWPSSTTAPTARCEVCGKPIPRPASRPCRPPGSASTTPTADDAAACHLVAAVLRVARARSARRRPTRPGPATHLLAGERPAVGPACRAPTAATPSASPGGSRRRSGDRATRPVVAAALLHDVGKVESGLGTYGRVVATAVGRRGRAGRRPSWSQAGASPAGSACTSATPSWAPTCWPLAGSDPLTVAWAREHHLPPDALDRRPRGRRRPQGRRRRLTQARWARLGHAAERTTRRSRPRRVDRDAGGRSSRAQPATMARRPPRGPEPRQAAFAHHRDRRAITPIATG